MNILPKTQLRIHNTITLSVLHLINFWVVWTDVFGVGVSWWSRCWDLRKHGSWNWIALIHLFRRRFGEPLNVLAPADLRVFLAPVHVPNYIFVLKSVERVQIGALLHFKSLICAIVSNFRHDPLLELPERGNRCFCPWQLDTGVKETFLQFPEGYDVKYSTYLPISDGCTSTYHIYDSQFILLLFLFPIEFDCIQPFAAQGEALAFFFWSFSRRHRSDQLSAMVVIVALISCGAGGTATAYHSNLTLSIAWHSCVSFYRLYTLLYEL